MRIVQIAVTGAWTLKTTHDGSVQGEARPVLVALCENGRVAWMEPDGYRNNWRPLMAVPDDLFDGAVERRVRRRAPP